MHSRERGLCRRVLHNAVAFPEESEADGASCDGIGGGWFKTSHDIPALVGRDVCPWRALPIVSVQHEPLSMASCSTRLVRQKQGVGPNMQSILYKAGPTIDEALPQTCWQVDPLCNRFLLFPKARVQSSFKFSNMTHLPLFRG